MRSFGFYEGSFIITVKTSMAIITFPAFDTRQQCTLATVFQQYPEFYAALIAQILPEALLTEIKSKGLAL